MPDIAEEETMPNVLELFSESLIDDDAVWARKISQTEKDAGRETPPSKQKPPSVVTDA